ncbi:MAG TPA: DNA internalization-related competence protein ComEC/Rec2 [Thermoanaerobaculia bacterium]|nr:DNA internalization-related competence protein ComEC/Rec2 [Thermoanaerobaculia bacterium]
MPDDVPAALPLLALIAGLASGAMLVNAPMAVAALVVCALLECGGHAAAAFRTPRPCRGCDGVAVAVDDQRRHGRRTPFLFAALGIALAAHQASVRANETRTLASIDKEQFVTIDAPLDRDWISHPPTHILRVRRFEANGIAIDRQLILYTRFAPPPIALRTTIHVEGLLHENDYGDLVVTVKSPRLMRYSGTLSLFDPERWNRAAAMRLERLGDTDEVALAEALALGRGERLDAELRGGFRRGGTYHLLVFSGMQIALAAALLAMWRRRSSDIALLVFSILAPLFIGPTASVSRASIAIGLFALSRLLKRPTSLPNLWCVAALLRLLIAPSDLTDAAFQLTYAGAGALIFIAQPLTKRRRWIAYALAAELTLTPLTLFHFHQYALGGSIATLLLTPLVSAMLVVSIAACIVPCTQLMTILGALNTACGAINDISAKVSGIYAAPPLVSMIVGFGAALVVLAFVKKRAIPMAIAVAIPTIAAIAQRYPSTPQLIAFDVGQGDSIAIKDGEHAILIDGGPSDTRLLPQLADRGIRHLDAVFLTHAHPDHCGGLPVLLDRLEVGQLWLSPRRFAGDCAQRLLPNDVPIHLVRDGDTANFGAIRIEAHAIAHTFRRSSENNASVVLRVQLERTRILMTGDIEREAESQLLERNLRADILKVAHHGSHSSSTPAFLDSVHPQLAVISCGRHNLFGHPHADVLRALQERRIRVLRTDRDHTIELDLHARVMDTQHVLHPPASGPLDGDHRPCCVRPARELRGPAAGRDDPGGDARQSADRRHCGNDHRRRGADVREGGESGGEEPLRRLPDADRARSDLLPRAPPDRVVGRG